jgi:hypothetical protein
MPIRKNDVCVVCGTKKNLTVDHVVPKAWGGTKNYAQILCREHNMDKGILIIDYEKKIIETQPYMFALNDKGREYLFKQPREFGCGLFDHYYREKFKQKYFNHERTN